MKLEISGRTELALSTLLLLSRRDEPSKGADIAHTLGTSAHYFPQVVRPLVHRGWITSERGPTGGYRLRIGLAEITLLELIEAVEGPVDSNRCVLRGKPCPAVDECAMHRPWVKARTALLAELSKTTLDRLPGPGAEAA